MNIEKLLASRLIRPGELAMQLWPHLAHKSALDRLYMKSNGTQGRSFSDDEKERLVQIWENLKSEIDS